jgi:hypothetical protein
VRSLDSSRAYVLALVKTLYSLLLQALKQKVIVSTCELEDDIDARSPQKPDSDAISNTRKRTIQEDDNSDEHQVRKKRKINASTPTHLPRRRQDNATLLETSGGTHAAGQSEQEGPSSPLELMRSDRPSGNCVGGQRSNGLHKRKLTGAAVLPGTGEGSPAPRNFTTSGKFAQEKPKKETCSHYSTKKGDKSVRYFCKRPRKWPHLSCSVHLAAWQRTRSRTKRNRGAPEEEGVSSSTEEVPVELPREKQAVRNSEPETVPNESNGVAVPSPCDEGGAESLCLQTEPTLGLNPGQSGDVGSQIERCSDCITDGGIPGPWPDGQRTVSTGASLEVDLGAAEIFSNMAAPVPASQWQEVEGSPNALDDLFRGDFGRCKDVDMGYWNVSVQNWKLLQEAVGKE